MDRIINVKVGGNHLSKDSKNAGVTGEGNVTNLRITFDEGWDGYAKTVTFWDAHGNNPVKRIETVDLLEDITKDTRTYITPIPKEALTIAGEITFVIDGYVDGKRQRSIEGKLIVKYSPSTDNAGEPTDPTPTEPEQWQTQIENIKGTIQNAAISAENAKASEANAKNSEENSQNSANSALESLNKAKEYADDAEESANRAENAIPHQPIIVNGYWHVWSIQSEEYIDTGIKAQAGSEVYVGANPPDTADVIIDPDGESALYAPYIGENGNWYTFNPETQTFTDSGNRAVAQDGYTPVKGVDYRDGISCTHSWNGTVLTVKSASGESSANLKGDKGEMGATGAKGDKGERGIQGLRGEKGEKGDKGDDYILTDKDKANIGNDVSAEIEAELNEVLDKIIDIQEEFIENELNQDKAFVFDVTLDDEFNVDTEATKEQITSAYEQGNEVIARVAYLGRTYLAPLINCEINKSFVSFVFDMFVDSGHVQLRLETAFITGLGYIYPWKVDYIEVATLADIENKADKAERFVYYSISHIELCDNSEYTIDEVSNLSITYPEGNFICSLTFTTVSEGIIDIRLPDSSKFIGEELTFKNGETWELSIKNGVVVGGVVK